MGREANCVCNWGNGKYEVKALLEPPELIVRGAMRKRVPFAKMKHVTADGNMLCFSVGDESVALDLGSTMAAKWAEALLKPAPTLAKKLGISSETVVRMIGPIDDAALKAALADAKGVSEGGGDLIVARVNTMSDLKCALSAAADQLRAGTPIWFVYRKGPGHQLSENLIRAKALASGIVDTKIAAVSHELSALRFVKRRI